MWYIFSSVLIFVSIDDYLEINVMLVCVFIVYNDMSVCVRKRYRHIAILEQIKDMH